MADFPFGAMHGLGVLAARTAFRPGLLDGTLVALLVVAVGGLIVHSFWWRLAARWRHWRLDRQVREALEAELLALLQDLGRALNQRHEVDLSSAETCGPPGAAPVARLLAEQLFAGEMPLERGLERYRAKLRRRAGTLNLLARLRRADEEFHATARRLDRRLIEVIGQHNASRHIDPSFDRLEYAYFLGCLLMLPRAAMPQLMGLPEEVVAAIQERFDAICAEPELAALVPPFLSARRRLGEAADELRTALGDSRREAGRRPRWSAVGC